MSLFQFGFSLSREEPSPEDSVEVEILESHIPRQEDTNLGVVEHRETAAAVVNLSRPAEISQPNQHPKRKRGKYFQYSGEDRVKIGKFASENGNKKTLERFIEEFPGLKESTVRAFKKAFREELSAQTRQGNVQLVTSLETQKRGRPPFLLELDSKLIAFLKNLRSRGGVVNGSVVSAAAKALISSNPSMRDKYLSFTPTRGWTQSIYKRCNFSRRAGTTTKPPVSRGVYDECKLTYLSDIDNCIKQHNIPPELILNADQTPSSYVSVGRMTMAATNSQSVPIKGLTDKRNITLTFVISLSGEFLPLQIIYQGKTKASLPRNFSFPKSFCVSQNPKHYSNEAETIGLIDSVINPYVVKKRKELGLPRSQKALLIWDVFRGQKTQKVCSKLSSLNIEVISVPANMTHFFQPLDLTVNGQAKKFCKNKFATWYSAEVQKQVDSGINFEDVDVDLKLSVLKPIHATWLVELYNFFTSTEGKVYVLKGWEKAGIKDVLNGKEVLPPVDPYQDIYAND